MKRESVPPSPAGAFTFRHPGANAHSGAHAHSGANAIASPRSAWRRSLRGSKHVQDRGRIVPAPIACDRGPDLGRQARPLRGDLLGISLVRAIRRDVKADDGVALEEIDLVLDPYRLVDATSEDTAPMRRDRLRIAIVL